MTTVDTTPGLIMGGFQVLMMLIAVIVASQVLYGFATLFATIGLVPAFYNCYFYRDTAPEVSMSMMASLIFTAVLILVVFILWVWMRTEPSKVSAVARQQQAAQWQPRQPASPMPARPLPHSDADRRLAQTRVMPMAEAHTEKI